MNHYQHLYTLVFNLIWQGYQPAPELEDARQKSITDLLQQIEKLPGTKEQKEAWGKKIGWELYIKKLYGA